MARDPVQRFEPPPWTLDMFPGIVGRYVWASWERTEAHPAAIGIQFLVTMGNLLSRASVEGMWPSQMIGETPHGLNEFTLVVGPTSSGRKGDAYKMAIAGLRRAADHFGWVRKWFTKCRVRGLSSGEGLGARIRDAGSYDAEDPGVWDKRMLLIATEFARVLKMPSRSGNVLIDDLCTSWNGFEPLATQTRTNPYTATNPCISMVGHITPRNLLRYAHLDELCEGGFLNRYLVVLVDRVGQYADPAPVEPKFWKEFEQGLKRIHGNAKRVVEFRLAPAAAIVWEKEYYPRLCRGGHRSEHLNNLLARGPAHVRRLAANFAILDDEPTITDNGICLIEPRHLDAALAWWHYVEASTVILFGDRVDIEDPKARRIYVSMPTPSTLTLTQAEKRYGKRKGGYKPVFTTLADDFSTEFTLTKEATGGAPQWTLKREEVKMASTGYATGEHPFSANSAYSTSQKTPKTDMGADAEVGDGVAEVGDEAAERGEDEAAEAGEDERDDGAAEADDGASAATAEGRAADAGHENTRLLQRRISRKSRKSTVGDGAQHDGARGTTARTTRSTTTPTVTARSASTAQSTARPPATTPSKPTSPPRMERPLWTRRPPPELDDQQAAIWDNARRHVDPEREEYAADPLARQQWLGHLERLDAVAARRRARRRPPSPGRP